MPYGYGMSVSTAYNQKLADSVCEYIMEGLSLRKIAAIDGMPKAMTVIKWLHENDSFQIQYARAREVQAEYYADEIIEIADNATDSAKARVQVDSRKWIAAKLKPKKFGEKITQEVTGAGGGPLQITQLDKDILKQYLERDMGTK